jgi:hypothetical protein
MTDTVSLLEEKKDPPYRPSWIDLLTNWVARRPGPPWLYYLGCSIFLLFVQFLILWMEGVPLSGSILSPLVYISAMIAILPALIHYLDDWAQATLEMMQPVLGADQETLGQLNYRLTTMPALPTLLAGIVVLGLIVFIEVISEPYQLETLAPYPVSTIIQRSLYLISWFIFGTFLVHTIQQLRAINHIYTRHVRIDILRASPLYAFSNLAALTAGALAAFCYGWFLVNPWLDLRNPLIVIPLVLLMFLALLVFILPQIGIHRLLVREKEHLQNEYAIRFESGIKQLHKMIDEENFEGISDLNTAMGLLQTERDALDKIPTWPWDPEVVRLLITALALPLGLWIIQLVLQRTFTP